MKKIIPILFIFTLIFVFKSNKEELIIPNNAIRFRVIANSDSLSDQNKKMLIKKNIEDEVYKLIMGVSNPEDVRKIIQNNLNTIDKIVKDYNIEYNINYGNNYFPMKNYKGVLYPAGNYESLVITLGKGAGSNFWCVLFPPLCLLENESADVSDVEYQLYVKKLLAKF